MTHSLTIDRLRSSCLTLLLLLLFGITTYAQTVIAPVTSDIILASTAAREGVNCDMLTTPSGSLMAFAYNTTTGIDIAVIDNAGGVANMTITGGQWGDVVLADSLGGQYGTEYILGVVYTSGTSDVYFNTYTLSNIGSGAITQALATNMLISSSSSGDIVPHIDMFADMNNMINGYPSLHQFVFTSVNYSGSTTDIVAYYGEISDPAGTLGSTTIVSSGAGSQMADVSASYDLNTGDQKAYFVVSTAGAAGLNILELNMSSLITTNLFTAPGAFPLYPRIESMGVFDNTVSTTPWTAVSAINTGANFQVWKLNSAGATNCSTSSLSTLQNFNAAVAAGIGSPGGSIFCNDNYGFGWTVEQNAYAVTRAIDYATGALNALYPNYYRVSNTTNAIPIGKVSFAMSSCSNSGKELLTAWNDGNGSVRYKVTTDITAYKPGATNVENMTSLNEVIIFPVPAKDLLTIDHPNTLVVNKIEIFNVLGQLLYQGNADKAGHTVLNIAGYSSGLYTIRINTDKGTIGRKLEIIK